MAWRRGPLRTMTLINTDTRGVRTHFLPPRHLTEPLDHYLHPSTLLSRKQLLFVEPDAETRELLHLFLGSLFHVVVVDTLEQGLECAGLNRPDLVAVSVAPDEEGNVSAFLDTIHTSYSGNEPAALAIVEGSLPLYEV